MKKVVLFGPLPEVAGQRLEGRYRVVRAPDGAALSREIGDAEGLLALLTLRVDQVLLDRAPALRVVANFAVGIDNVDLAACTRRGVVVTNTPDILTETTADLAFGLLLAAARRIPEADRELRAGRWRGFRPTYMLGSDVFGKTLGIVGLGRIGQAVARRAEGFRMRVVYAAPRPVPAVPYQRLPLDVLLAQADFVSLHCPLLPATRHLVDREALARLRPGAILVNTARGALVDEPALVEWVQAGGRAALDVFEDEPAVPAALVASENVVLTPHIGSASLETRTRMAEMTADSIDAVLSGRRPAHPVNPEALG